MNPISPNFSASSAALLAGLLLVPMASQASQMAYEGFDYAPGSLTGQTGGSGWNGGWVQVNNGGADLVTGSLTAGGGAPAGFDARSIGNSANLTNARRTGRFLNTSTNGPFGARGYRDANGNIGKDGTTLYLSFLQQPNTASKYYEFEFHRGDLGDTGRIAGIGNDTDTSNVNLRSPGNVQTAIGAGSTAVNFYVVRIDFKAGNDDIYVYRNPTSATDPGTGAATLSKPNVPDMSFNGISFGAFVGSTTVAHDEVRFGQTWDDVTLPVNAQPVIANQPQTATTTYTGGTFSLNAVANGYPEPTYQWYKGSTLLPGQTSPTLTLTNVQPGDAGAYHLAATNSQGSVDSSDATLVVQTTPAGLLAYEGFDYISGTSNMNRKAGGLGWGAAWVDVNGGGGKSLAGSLAAGTNAPNGYDAQSLGNSDFMPNAKRDGRLLDTSEGGRLYAAGYVDVNGNVGADGKTLYLSFLQQPDGTSKFYEFEFHKGNLGDPGRIAGIGNDTSNPVVNLRAPNGATSLIGPGSTGVNFYVVRIDFKPGNDDVRVYQNPISAAEPGTPTLIKAAVADMSFNGLSLAAFENNRTVKHDEIRLGQNWSDVVFGTSRLPLTWVGNGTTNNWSTDANWSDGTGTTPFTDGNPVTFNDNGSDSPAVNVTTSVSTGSLTVTGDTKNYTIGGTGTINCSGGLTKSGAGSLTLTGPSNFSSAVIVSGGTLALNGTTLVGSQLNLNAGTLATTLGGTNTFTGTLFANAGTLALTGTNSLGGLVTTNTATTITGPTSITGTGGTTVFIGNLPGANASLTVEAGGSLNITGVFNDAWVIGRDGGNGSVVQNGGTITFNPSNHPDAFIGASDAGGTVASYDMNGGTLEMSNVRLGLAIGPITASLNQSGGTINVRQLELGSNGTTGNGIYTLSNTGVINIGSGGIITSVKSVNSEVNLKGGTVAATANWGSQLAMKLINTVTFDSGANTVTLSGGLTDLDASTAPGALVKTGTGTLVLAAFNNNYTGPTTVAAGTLSGYGTGEASAVTVAAGASIAPGVGLGPFYSGSTISFAANSTLKLEISSTNGQADQLAASGDINIANANVTFADVGSGYFAAGTEIVIVESATNRIGTFAGYAEGAQVTVGSNKFTIHYNATQVTLTSLGSPYGNWAVAKGLDGSPGKEQGFNDDPEGDGIANGLEWALGGNPLGQDGGSLVTTTGSATNGLTLTFFRDESSLGNVTLNVQWGDGFDAPPADVPVTQAGGSYPNGVTVGVDQTSTPDVVTVNIPATNAPGGKLFARLQATLP